MPNPVCILTAISGSLSKLSGQRIAALTILSFLFQPQYFSSFPASHHIWIFHIVCTNIAYIILPEFSVQMPFPALLELCLRLFVLTPSIFHSSWKYVPSSRCSIFGYVILSPFLGLSALLLPPPVFFCYVLNLSSTFLFSKAKLPK